jgi:hypothetical protein
MCPTKELLRCEFPGELDISSRAGADGPSLATRRPKHRALWPTTHAFSISSDRTLPLRNSRPCLSKSTRHLAIFRRRTLCSSSNGAPRPKATTRITIGSTCSIFRPTTSRESRLTPLRGMSTAAFTAMESLTLSRTAGRMRPHILPPLTPSLWSGRRS